MDNIYNNLTHQLSHDQFYIEYQEPPQEMLHYHWHNHIEFNYLYSGTMEYIFGDQSCIIPSQQLVFFWGGIPHKSVKITPDEDNKTARLCNLYYPLENFLLWDKSTEIQNLLMGGSILTLKAPIPFIHMLINIWRHDVKQREQKAIEPISLEIRALLNRYHFDSLLSPHQAHSFPRKQASNHKQKLFVQTLHYILKNLQNPLKNQSIANHLGFHSNYVQRNFQEILGISLHQFIIQTRLKYACSLLSETNRSILDIAIEAGFGSISQFYKCFHQYYKKTPKQYRTSLR